MVRSQTSAGVLATREAARHIAAPDKPAPGSQRPDSRARGQRHGDGRSSGLSRRQRSSPPTDGAGITPPPIITVGLVRAGPVGVESAAASARVISRRVLARLVGLLAVQQSPGCHRRGRILGDQMHHRRVRLRSAPPSSRRFRTGKRVGLIGPPSPKQHLRAHGRYLRVRASQRPEVSRPKLWLGTGRSAKQYSLPDTRKSARCDLAQWKLTTAPAVARNESQRSPPMVRDYFGLRQSDNGRATGHAAASLHVDRRPGRHSKLGRCGYTIADPGGQAIPRA